MVFWTVKKRIKSYGSTAKIYLDFIWNNTNPPPPKKKFNRRVIRSTLPQTVGFAHCRRFEINIGWELIDWLLFNLALTVFHLYSCEQVRKQFRSVSKILNCNGPMDRSCDCFDCHTEKGEARSDKIVMYGRPITITPENLSLIRTVAFVIRKDRP